MKSLPLAMVLLFIIGLSACSQEQKQSGVKEIKLEFGQLDDQGKLKFSDKKSIQFNFDDPSKSKSTALKVGTATHARSKLEVTSITQVGGGGVIVDPPIHALIIIERGHVFDHQTDCYVYGTIITDTDTGASWFFPADPATQSTMNNCNYGDVA